MAIDPSEIKGVAAQLATGDPRAFEILFTAFMPQLRRYAYGYVRSWDVAEEVVQEVFMRVWDRRTELDLGAAPARLLYTMVRHRAINHLKRVKIEERVMRLYSPSTLTQSDVIEHIAGVDIETLDAALERAVQALTSRQREILLLRWRNGASYEDIAQRLGIAAGTVAAHLKQAMAQLRATIPKAVR